MTKELVCSKHHCVPNGIRLSWCMNQRCDKLVWMCRVDATINKEGKNDQAMCRITGKVG